MAKQHTPLLILGLKDLDSGLGAYPYESLKKWISLSNYISHDLVTRYVYYNIEQRTLEDLNLMSECMDVYVGCSQRQGR